MVWERIKSWLGLSRAPDGAVGGDEPEVDAQGKDTPVSFGYKISWLCLKTTDTQAVIGALNVREAKEATWRKGLGIVYREIEYLFVTPPVDGWILVLGYELIPEVNEPGALEAMRRLSERFEDAYYFGSHRVSSYYAWIAGHRGEVTRAFGIGDSEILVNLGKPTQKELSLGYPAIEDVWMWCDEEHVVELAKAWCLDPQSLEGRETPEGPGWLCRKKGKAGGVN